MSTNGDQGRLTTHVLDTVAGVPAANLTIELYRIEGETRDHVKTIATNDDGRCDGPMLEGDAFAKGEYELVFHIGDYFADSNGGGFLNLVPVRFIVSNADQHYHVPLLASPFSYSTYRGS
ncbi:MAG: hydroxyisourate hydrolase [Hyphomicrobiales bacterium]